MVVTNKINKLSIVMPCYKRRQQLLNTLKSIEYFNKYPIEIIIVDSGGDEKNPVNDVVGLFPSLNILIVTFKNKIKDNVLPTNMGLNVVTGDAILVNGAECIHHGDIIGYIFNNLTAGTYMNFSTYSVDDGIVEKLSKINWDD